MIEGEQKVGLGLEICGAGRRRTEQWSGEQQMAKAAGHGGIDARTGGLFELKFRQETCRGTLSLQRCAKAVQADAAYLLPACAKREPTIWTAAARRRFPCTVRTSKPPGLCGAARQVGSCSQSGDMSPQSKSHWPTSELWETRSVRPTRFVRTRHVTIRQPTIWTAAARRRFPCIVRTSRPPNLRGAARKYGACRQSGDMSPQSKSYHSGDGVYWS